jgi:hypothetical protein
MSDRTKLTMTAALYAFVFLMNAAELVFRYHAMSDGTRMLAFAWAFLSPFLFWSSVKKLRGAR